MKQKFADLLKKHFGENIPEEKIKAFVEEVEEIKDDQKQKIQQLSTFKCAFLKNIPFLGWIKDAEGRFITVNQPFANFYQTTEAEIVGKTDYDICPKDLAEKYINEDKEVIHTKRAQYSIKKTQNKNGKYIWIESYKKPFFDHENNIGGTTGYARNVTSQKENELAITENEQRFKKIVDNIQDGITIIEEGEIIFCNDRISYITGYSNEEFKKLHINQLIDDQDRERIISIQEEAKNKNKEIKELEFWIRRKDGERRYINNRYSYVKNNGITGRYIITTDITERKIAEDNLKRSEKIFRGFFDLPLTGIAITGPDMAWVEVNDKLCNILGYSKEEFLELSWDDLTPDEDKEFQEKQLFKKVESGEMDGTTIEKQYIRKDGSFIHAFICTSCIKNESGQVEYFFSMIDDITYKVQIEEQLERLMKKLETMNQELEKKVKKEVQKNREKELMLAQQSKHAALGEMIGNIAHQWRQPLNAVGLIIQDLEEAHEFGELDEPYLKEKVKKSMDLIEFMSQTIDDFRQFFRLDKVIQEFSIKEVVTKAVSFVEASFNNHNIKISVEDFEDITIKGYTNEYAQVLLNLLNNSRDALIESNQEFPEIMIRCEYINGKSRLEISDNGKGIPEEIIDKIFEPYYTTKDAAIGTGIGLYMSKTIIEHNMKGKLTAESKTEGAKFIIEI